MNKIVRGIYFLFKTVKQLENYGGLRTYIKGASKFLKYSFLQKHYNFSSWHTRPIEWRPYGLAVCRFANQIIREEKLSIILEIGCGLGDILSEINGEKKIGFDNNANVIRAGKAIKKDIEFHQGSFKEIKNLKIDLLITVNFMHDIPPNKLKDAYKNLIKYNDIKYIIVDKVKYRFCHNFENIFENKFTKIWESEQFEHERKIMCYKNTIKA